MKFEKKWRSLPIFCIASILMSLIACSEPDGGSNKGPDPNYSISLSQTEAYTFTAAVFGYSTRTPLTVTIGNTGNQATGTLTIGLSGENASSFNLSTRTVNSIAVGSSGNFSITPNNGLAIGTYTATVTVSGGNGITAQFNVNFTVNAKNAAFTIDPIEAQTYTGSAIQPTVTVRDGTTLLTLNTDYTVSYENNINVGTATVTINGIGNYLGSTGNANFSINAKVVTFIIDSITVQTYTRSAIQPAVTVRDGTTLLTLNTDYTVSYENNINVGTASVTISGNGNYAGSSGSANFTINPKVTTFSVDSIAAQPYTGNAIQPPVNVKDGNTVLTLNTDYNVNYANNINIGTANVTITGIGNYAGSSGSANFTISASIVTITIDTIAAQTYTGNAIQPAITVKDGAKILTLNTDYTVSYTNNINTGIASVTITGIGGYAGSFGSANFTINPNVITFSVDSITAQTYTRSAIQPTVTVRDGTTILIQNTHYTVSYLNNTNVGIAKVTITGIGNYEGSTGSTNFNINPKVTTFNVDSIASRTYTGNQQLPTVTVRDGTTVLTLGSDYEVSYSNNINAGTATVTVTGSGNYEGSSGSRTFTINKALGAYVVPPTMATRTHNSITINALTTSTGQNVEYAISLDNTLPTTGWQEGLTFNGLISNAIYNVFARAKANENYETGVASSAEITTTVTSIILYWINEQDILATTWSTIIIPGQICYIYAQDLDYTNQRWSINGVLQSSANDRTNYNFSSLVSGKYNIGLLVEKDGKFYDANFVITVEE